MAVGVASLIASVAQAAPKEEQFMTMPLNATANITMKTNSYSGYLTVTESKALHYVFVESQNDPATDPVVIWYNGGPGCSSLLGFFQENGPFVIDDDGSIYENPHPWYQNASVLYIEQPAGVGYSIANLTSDKSTNDMRSSQDGVTALLAWYAKFPEYMPNELFVSGESYGGIYVPYLSWQIYQHNVQANVTNTTGLNFQGFMVGNGATNWDVDVSPSFPETLYQFNMVPRHLIDFMNDNGCVYYFNDFRAHDGPTTCDAVWEKIQSYASELNWYDLYRPADTNPLNAKTAASRMGKVVINGEERTYKKGYTMADYTPWVKNVFKGEGPLMGSFLSDYVNSAALREALHIPAYAPTWSMCWDESHSYQITPEASHWIYPILKANGIRLMFYSGDTDGALPTYGTKRWIKRLGWNIKNVWRPWLTDGQVSGYIEQYEGLDFITVKGTGHMAPQWKRPQVTQMITRWIHGEAV